MNHELLAPTTASSANRNGVRGRLLRGLGATALAPVVTGIIQLGSVPLLLHAWGAERYGDWLLLSAIPSYLTLSDLGFGDASGSEMSMRVAAHDQDGALQIFQSSWVLVTTVSLVALLLASLTVWWIPWHRWLRLSSVSSLQAATVVIILAIYVLVALQNGVAESGYRCDGHFATGTVCGSLLRLAEVAAATVVAVLGAGVVAAACTLLVTRILGSIAYIALLRHISPWIRFGMSHARLSTIRRMAPPAFGFMSFPLGYALNLQGLTIVIGALLGPVAVVSFSTLRTLSRLNLQLAVIVKHALWPELSRAFGSGDLSLMRHLHRYACQSSLVCSALGSILLWIFGPPIYRIWTHQQVSFDASSFHLLLLVGVITSLWNTSAVVPMSINRHCRIAVAFAGSSLLSLALAGILIPSGGTGGAAVALLVADAYMVALVLRTALRHVQDTLGKFVPALFVVPPFRHSLHTAPEA